MEYFRQKYLSVQKIQTIEYIFLNTSDKTKGIQNNLKSDEGKSCLIPDIIQYSLAESLILRGYIWFLIDIFVIIPRPSKQIINRTFSVHKQYLPINLETKTNSETQYPHLQDFYYYYYY